MEVKVLILISIGLCIEGHQRSPPGINPNQYQGQHKPPPPPQYQQQQQQQQYHAAPPGVPPQQQQQQYQQYQQPPPAPQQHQQPPPQQHQPPPQQQQQHQPPPQQQQHHQPPPQQQPPHQPHGQHQQRVLHNPNIGGERDHIKDHLEVPLDTAGMSEQELQFHYFKMHDADNNNKLDGQELIKSLFHWHDENNHDPAKNAHPPPDNKIFQDDELVSMIDPILDQDDRNKDGYIDYPEFVQAQRNAAASNSKT